MARTAAELQAYQDAFQKYLGRQSDQAGIDAFNNSGISLDNRIREIMGSDEYKQRVAGQAANIYQPQISQVDRATAQTTSDMDTLIKQLQQQQQDAPEQIFNDFNRRGLFRSSASQKAVADTVGKLTSQLGNAQIQRSTRLADLAAQRANLLNQQQSYIGDVSGRDRQGFESYVSQRDAEIAKQQAEEQKRQYEMQMQQLQLQRALASASNRGSGSALDSTLATLLGGSLQSQQQQNQPQYDPNEDLAALLGGQPAQDVEQPPQSTGTNAPNWPWMNGTNQFGTFNNNPVKNYLSSVQTPSFLQGIFGKNLFAKG